MAKCVKEATFGFFNAYIEDDSPNWKYVVLSREEYSALYKDCDHCRRCKSLRDEIKRAEEYGDFYREALSETKKSHEEERGKMHYDMAIMERQTKAATEAAWYLKRLNKNLLRMNRERANAARGLRPKKEHTGYTVQLSEERERHFQRDTQHKVMQVWETRIQSPYSMEFTAEQARGQMLEDMDPDGEIRLLEKLGIGKFYAEGFWKINSEQDNAAFELRLRANYHSGYWEGILAHTKPLSSVPREMQPPKRKNAPNGSERDED